ncbi:MAG: hypothetical protein Q8Q01_05650 [archaeon]|nr:hypothetical protein [archaeon]
MIKPITYVTTYRGVNNFEMGLHEGESRIVIIAGSDSPPRESRNWNIVPASFAGKAYQNAQEAVLEIIGLVDEMYVYLGLDGAGLGFEYVGDAMGGDEEKDITLVACGCVQRRKELFARQHKLPIIWAECGGRSTLEGIVREKLSQ